MMIAVETPRPDDLNQPPSEEDIRRLQFSTLLYYLHETNPDNGLVARQDRSNAPASIAAIGIALATLPVVVERALSPVRRQDRTPAASLLLRLPARPEPDASGYKGFFYHFLDIETGRRVWNCELSTIDSAFLFAGALTVATYFDGDTPMRSKSGGSADALYERADWEWALNGGLTVTHGWRPETGFLPYRWEGYDEGLMLYLLGLGSPTHALPAESYAAYTSTYQWKSIYGWDLLYSGPLFTHQLSHMAVLRLLLKGYILHRYSCWLGTANQMIAIRIGAALVVPVFLAACANSSHRIAFLAPNVDRAARRFASRHAG